MSILLNVIYLSSVIEYYPMKKIFVLFFIFLFPCFSPVFASSSLEKELVVGVSTGYPPYYYEKNGELGGICIEILNNIASSLGIEVVFKKLPWKRMLISAKMGEVDAVMPLFRTSDRQQYLEFKDLILAYEEVNFFVLKDSEIQFRTDYRELFTYPIGVVDGYSYGEKFDNEKNLVKILTQNDRHLLEMFSHGRFSVGVGNRQVVSFNANKMGINDRIRFISPPLSREPLYLGFSKVSRKKHFSQLFATKLQELKNSGGYDQIIDKYDLAGEKN